MNTVTCYALRIKSVEAIQDRFVKTKSFTLINPRGVNIN